MVFPHDEDKDAKLSKASVNEPAQASGDGGTEPRARALAEGVEGVAAESRGSNDDGYALVVDGRASDVERSASVGEPHASERLASTDMSATAELATMLEHQAQVGTHAPKAKPIDMESERSDAPISWRVVIPTIAIVGLVVGCGLAFPTGFAAIADTSFSWIMTDLGWAYVLCGTVFVAFVVTIAVSSFGSIRLGRSDEQPEFSTPSWIAMMFAAGMGIGLMFYGASEPLAHYANGVPGHEPHEVGTAFATAMFHWTLHPWALYAIVGLAIAYSTYRVGRRQLISAAFTPLVGQKRSQGTFGTIVDILAIVATVFGTACSLGLGALQIRAGLAASGLMANPGMGTIVGIVLVLTLAFVLSAMSGVGRGIQYLSNANMVLAALLAIFVFVLGPTVVELNVLPMSIGTYLDDFFSMAARTASSANGTAGEWMAGWTIFYWAWWISWSPFVGMFLARISRGRTVREFCIGVMLVPAGLSTLWFAIFGGTAVTLEQSGVSLFSEDTESQLFHLLHTMPGGTVAGIVAMVLLATFFVTSADSASTVMGSMSQSGLSTAHRGLSAMWGVLTALVGLTLLLVGGRDALSSVQSVTIVAATPFLFIILGLMVSTVMDMRGDELYFDRREHEQFMRKLAIERRHVREREERRARRLRRPRINPGRPRVRRYRPSK